MPEVLHSLLLPHYRVADPQTGGQELFGYNAACPGCRATDKGSGGHGA